MRKSKRKLNAIIIFLAFFWHSANAQITNNCTTNNNGTYACWSTLNYVEAVLPAIISATSQRPCTISVVGTANPPNSGTPALANSTNGMVMFANFFNSGAITNPTDEFVEVCVTDPDNNGKRITRITADVGTTDNATIKAYPELIIGTKFGIVGETSYRPYPTLTSSTGFEYPNLVNIASAVGLPAFTSDLPNIDITVDIDEQNVVGANRDVMMESWFHDTSINEIGVGYSATLSGGDSDNDGIDNAVDADNTGGADTNSNGIDDTVEIVNTLNNIVGDGHPDYPGLSNLLLEMMVHIGPLNKHDVSQATRNPGQFQLTDVSGNDTNNNSIDDGWDAALTGGPDLNSDGTDDSKMLPITIGSYKYSIWYGSSQLAPIVIYSRESRSDGVISVAANAINTDLTTEGPLNLNWNQFLNYTLNNIEPLLQAKNVSWATGSNNPFPKMRASGGAISGLELGVEPQTNNPADAPYIATINQYDVLINDLEFAAATEHANTPLESIKTGVRGHGVGCSLSNGEQHSNAPTDFFLCALGLWSLLLLNRKLIFKG